MKLRCFLFFFLLNAGALFAQCGSVMCIHGLVSSSRDFNYIKKELANCDYWIYLWDYPSTRRFFCEHAENLCRALQAVASAHPGEPIHFVAHSSGGIVLRAALNRPDCPPEAKMGRAVLFAPPNQGSRLGRDVRCVFPLRFFLGSKSGLELMTYYPEDMLRRFGNFPPSMEVLVIAGTKGVTYFKEPNDGYVTLEETYLNTPYYLLTYPVTHGHLIQLRPALCQMRSFIEKGCCN